MFEGCIFWHVIGKATNVKNILEEDADLFLKINKRYSVELNPKNISSKEELIKAKDAIMKKLSKEIDKAFEDYCTKIN